jgi:hypothetical protein
MNKKRDSMRQFKRIILASVCLLVIAVVAVSLFNHFKLISTFAKVGVGDRKETVVQMLGQPDEVENCSGSDSNEDVTKRCVETYWYMSFLERWGFSFNKDGKVIDKTHNVSF